MALQMYLDDDGAKGVLIDESNPDEVKGAVESGETLTDEVMLWIESDDSSLTYENIVLSENDPAGDDDEVVITYAEDDAGSPQTYSDPLNLPDGKYDTAVPIWRKAVAENVTGAFYRDDITHQLQADEYVDV